MPRPKVTGGSFLCSKAVSSGRGGSDDIANSLFTTSKNQDEHRTLGSICGQGEGPLLHVFAPRQAPWVFPSLQGALSNEMLSRETHHQDASDTKPKLLET